jgi:hypothetical protein
MLGDDAAETANLFMLEKAEAASFLVSWCCVWLLCSWNNSPNIGSFVYRDCIQQRVTLFYGF